MSTRHIGRILVFSSDAKGGVIVSPSGKRYLLELSQWSAARPPEAGESVSFLAHERHAYDVRIFGVSQAQSNGKLLEEV